VPPTRSVPDEPETIASFTGWAAALLMTPVESYPSAVPVPASPRPRLGSARYGCVEASEWTNGSSPAAE
jgi:hypothetical protein